MKRILYSCILVLFAAGCHQTKGTSQENPGNTATDSTKKSFLPVADYLRAEISYVDSTPLAIREYIVRGDKKDSGFIQPGEFNRLASEFLLPELAPDNFEQHYTETSFMDETTKSLSFTYSTPDKTLPLQRVDVLAAPSGDFQRIKSIYLQQVYMTGDTQVVKKLYWKSRHNFLIIKSMQPAHQPALVQQLQVIWAPDDDDDQN